MEKKSNQEIIDPSAGLLPAIMLRIEQEQRKRLRIGIAIWACTAGVSCIGMAYAFSALQREIVRAGIPQFLSLIFSSPNAVRLFWNDFMLSILGSLPVLNILLALIPTLALLASIKFLGENIGTAREMQRIWH